MFEVYIGVLLIQGNYHMCEAFPVLEYAQGLGDLLHPQMVTKRGNGKCNWFA